MSDVKLKNCPFCGEDQNVEHDYAEYVFSANDMRASRICWVCGAEAPGVWIDDYDSEEEWMLAADEEWNTRY